MHRATRAILSTLAATILFPAAAGAQPAPAVIFDGEFADSDWEVTATGTNGATETAARNGTGGSPGAFRDMVNNMTAPSNLTARHLYLGATYDPATQGAVAAVTYGEDHIEFDPPFTGAAVGAIFFIEQEGNIHFSSAFTYTDTSWTHVKLTCLKPANFSLSGGHPPDFSATAAPLRFGFLRSNTNDSTTAGFPVKHGIDNFRVVVFTAPNPDCVGEPPDVHVGKTDNGHLWGDNALVPYTLSITNSGGTATDTALVETVPQKTIFTLDGSTPGWTCSPDVGAGSTCTFAVNDLAVDETRSVTFAIHVNEDTDARWDVYNEAAAGGTSPSTPTPIVAVDAGNGIVRATEAIVTTLHGLGSDLTPHDEDELGGCAGVFSTPYSCCAWCFFNPDDCTDLFKGELVSFVAHEEAGAPKSDPILLYRLRDRVFANTPGGERATTLYYELTDDLVLAAMLDADVVTLGRTNLLDWQPSLQALVSGQGIATLVTQEQIDGLNAFLDALRAAADATLAEVMDRERPRLNLDDWVGITIEEALGRLDRLTCGGHTTELFCGEITGDCAITASDALAALRIAVGLDDAVGEADMDASGNVTAGDALRVLRIAVGSDAQTTACNAP
jgi:hypothetical protein